MKTKTKITREVPQITRAEFYTLLTTFMERLQTERRAVTFKLHGDTLKNYHNIGYDEGSRFVRVWDARGIEGSYTQKGVSYFVEKDTGVIFGAKSWLQYNANREYGTLMTMDEYEWGDYYGARKDGKSTLVPKDKRR